MSVIDFHTHVLPSVDDGSASVEQSIAMLKKLYAQGVECVVATPHFYPTHNSPERFLERRGESVRALKQAMRETEDMPRLIVGAEVHFFDGISDCEFLRDMAIEGTDCILVEMPMKDWSDRNLQELSGIRQKQKLTPIIAHVDRYVRPIQGYRAFDRLSTLPVYIQVNAGFFTKCTTRRLAINLLVDGKIHLLGSDCHNLTDRAPNIDKAVAAITRALGDAAVGRINRLEQKLLNTL